MENNEHIVYILKCGDDTFYTGYTNDLENRVTMHEDGKGAKYTRGRGPFQVVFVEKLATKEEALQREYQVKQLSRKEKVKLIREKLKEVMQYATSEEF
ncbi:GIY-YIG nuclease family protein [Lentibacillus halophilus]|uniref:GIY-YIG nuclease family protein n=1 Tax=Lentibacillus halophilus TaxID=295065 RepID=A0ABN0Z9E9_9BACI